jgi:hypothetical protein
MGSNVTAHTKVNHLQDSVNLPYAEVEHSGTVYLGGEVVDSFPLFKMKAVSTLVGQSQHNTLLVQINGLTSYMGHPEWTNVEDINQSGVISSFGWSFFSATLVDTWDSITLGSVPVITYYSAVGNYSYDLTVGSTQGVRPAINGYLESWARAEYTVEVNISDNDYYDKVRVSLWQEVINGRLNVQLDVVPQTPSQQVISGGRASALVSVPKSHDRAKNRTRTTAHQPYEEPLPSGVNGGIASALSTKLKVWFDMKPRESVLSTDHTWYDNVMKLWHSTKSSYKGSTPGFTFTLLDL